MTPGKLRTREHVLADLSVNYVERVAFRCGYAVMRSAGADYGIDLYVTTYAADGRFEPGELKVQLKATDAPAYVSGGTAFSLQVRTADLASWRYEPVPVLLVLYDARQDRAYWLDVREWALAMRPDAADFRTRTVRVRIPIENRLTVPAMRVLRRRKNEVLAFES